MGFTDLFNCMGVCVMGTFRWVTFIINFLLLLLGGSTIFFGVAILTDSQFNHPWIPAAFILPSGLLLVIFSFAGCWGTVRGSPFFLKMYAGGTFIGCSFILVTSIILITYSSSAAAITFSIISFFVQLTAGILSLYLAKSFEDASFDQMRQPVL